MLVPAVALAARRAGAGVVALVGQAEPDLDRVCVRYDDGRVLGDPASPLQVTATVRGGRPVPATPLPEVVRVSSVDAVPAGALAVVTSVWALSRLLASRRPAELARLQEAAVGRPIAWVTVEGVGVVPGRPDARRPAGVRAQHRRADAAGRFRRAGRGRRPLLGPRPVVVLAGGLSRAHR